MRIIRTEEYIWSRPVIYLEKKLIAGLPISKIKKRVLLSKALLNVQ